jgi:hypothetical protein
MCTLKQRAQEEITREPGIYKLKAKSTVRAKAQILKGQLTAYPDPEHRSPCCIKATVS